MAAARPSERCDRCAGTATAYAVNAARSVSANSSTAILDGCLIAGNGDYGIATALDGATIYTRSNNVLHYNAAPYEQYGIIFALGAQ